MLAPSPFVRRFAGSAGDFRARWDAELSRQTALWGRWVRAARGARWRGGLRDDDRSELIFVPAVGAGGVAMRRCCPTLSVTSGSLHSLVKTSSWRVCFCVTTVSACVVDFLCLSSRFIELAQGFGAQGSARSSARACPPSSRSTDLCPGSQEGQRDLPRRISSPRGVVRVSPRCRAWIAGARERREAAAWG